MAPTYMETFMGFLGPWAFMYKAFSFMPFTILRLIRSRSFSTLLRPRALQSAWFSDFWSWAGPQIRDNAGPKKIAPLLLGRIHAGEVVDTPQHPPVSGVVLEIGPGTGMWVRLFAPGALGDLTASSTGATTNGDSDEAADLHYRGPAPPRITRVIGVEPSASVHDALRAEAVRAGLADVYEIVPVGIESLASTGAVTRGEVDCIVSILCLCSIPDPERNIRELYGYLKPGGRWYAYEHVRCDSCRRMVWYQAFVNLFWPQFLGGCQLRRETGKTLREAGPWTDIDLAQPPDEPWFQTVPHVLGILTK